MYLRYKITFFSFSGMFMNVEKLQLDSKQFFMDIPFWKMSYEFPSQSTDHIRVRPNTKSQLQLFSANE